MITETQVLTESQIEQFHRDGFLAPLKAFTPDEMKDIRAELEADVFPTTGPDKNNSGQSRHLDKRVVYDMCSHPSIVGSMADAFSPNLLLWRSNFFKKEPGAWEIPWHQDRNYWPLDPVINITAWLAVTPSTIENSCVQVIPGSHRLTIPHIQSTDNMAFDEMADPEYVEAERAVNIELLPGEFVLFDERLLHHSYANTSDKERNGLAIRVTVPKVNVTHDELFPNHGCILLHGDDTHNLNHMVGPPA